jgi:glycosyltransferase involved in cell wall biosynthesis
MKILIIIPALNEARMIGTVVTDLVRHGYPRILVVDDGSTDKTGQIAKRCGARVLTHIVNRGLGAGLGTGLEYARISDCDVAVTFDADGQHRAEDIINLIKPILKNRADVVVGTRANYFKEIPLLRRAVNVISNVATSIIYGVMTSDATSGLRALNRKAIEKICLKTDRMEVSNEFFREIRLNKLRYAEVDIKPIYTEYSLKSSKQGNIIWSSLILGTRMVFRMFR